MTPSVRTGAGMLALVGGDEFNPGNEEQDRLLAAAAGPGPAFVVPTAAARGGPEVAVKHAIRWVKQFGLDLRELPVLRRGDAGSAALAARALEGGVFYLVGCDPAHVAQVSRGSAGWSALFAACSSAAAIAGCAARVNGPFSL